ncbi:MAG: diguanylate cyclase [Rhodocyclales bacterium]|nr:diguanylate cyclase [Rhodocyclales bacterium]
MSSRASSVSAPAYVHATRLRVAALAIVTVAALACSLYWWRLAESQEQLEADTVAQIGLRASQLADAVAGQTAILVRLVDFAIQHLRDDYSDARPAAFVATVKSVLDAFPPGAILQIGVIDRDGYLAYSNLGLQERVYLGDREHFKVHQAAGEERLFVSQPVFGRVSKSWSIQFTRAIRKDDRFLGVLVLSVAPEYIASNLARQELGRDDIVALFRSDGTYLSRSRDLANAMGRAAPSDRPFIGSLAPASGVFRVAAAFDRVERTYAWRRLEDVPLVVNVGMDEDVVLAPVRHAIALERVRNTAGVAVVMLLAFGMAALLLAIAARQRALAESENRYRSFFETNTAVKLLIDPVDGHIVDANAAALAFYGYTREELLAMPIGAINCLPAERIQAEMRDAEAERRQYFNFTHRLKSGELRQVEVYSGPVDIGGRHLLFSIIHDVTERHKLEASQRLAKSVFDAAGEAIIVSDAENRIVAVNPAFTRITGYQPQEVLGQNPRMLASGLHDAGFYRLLWQRLLQDDRWEGEISNRRKDGQVFVEWLKIAVVRDEDGLPQQFVALFSDVTERKRHDEVVWRQANFDSLTGLPNRQLLDDRLERALAQAARRHTLVAVLYIDLDRFKPVNDRYGHAAGDDLLCQVAQRLRNALRDEDTVARVGGDEFVAVLPDVAVGDMPARAAEKIIAALSAPYRVWENYVEISCSIGIAVYPRDGADAIALLEKADRALYGAKHAGRSIWTMA